MSLTLGFALELLDPSFPLLQRGGQKVSITADLRRVLGLLCCSFSWLCVEVRVEIDTSADNFVY